MQLTRNINFTTQLALSNYITVQVVCLAVAVWMCWNEQDTISTQLNMFSSYDMKNADSWTETYKWG